MIRSVIEVLTLCRLKVQSVNLIEWFFILSVSRIPKGLKQLYQFPNTNIWNGTKMISLSAWMKEREENKWTLAAVSANQMARPVNIPSSLFWLCYFNEHLNF